MKTVEKRDSPLELFSQALKDAIDPYVAAVHTYSRLSRTDDTVGVRNAIKRGQAETGIAVSGLASFADKMPEEIRGNVTKIALVLLDEEGSIPNDLLGQAYEKLMKIEETCISKLEALNGGRIADVDGIATSDLSEQDISLLHEIEAYIRKSLGDCEGEFSQRIEDLLLDLSTRMNDIIREQAC